MIPFLAYKDGKYYDITIGEEEREITPVAYVLGKNGLYLRNINTGHSIVRLADKSPLKLDEVKEEITFNYPTISYNVYRQVLAFCRAVYQEHHSEANVLLVLNRAIPLKDQEYRIIVPKQEVSSAAVDYPIPREELGEDEFFAGTIHSHPNFSAFQSGVDHKDEARFDGIHVTLGYITKSTPEIHARVCLCGEFYEPKNDVIDITPPAEKVSVPEEWMKKVEKKTYSTGVQTWPNGAYGRRIGSSPGHVGFHNNPNRLVGKKSMKEINKLWKMMKPRNLRTLPNSNQIVAFD